MDNVNSSTIHTPIIHHDKRLKEVDGFSPPAYASTTTDVYFGRWQATPPSPPKSVVSPLLSPPMPSFAPQKEWGERLPPLRAIMSDNLVDDRILPPLRH